MNELLELFEGGEGSVSFASALDVSRELTALLTISDVLIGVALIVLSSAVLVFVSRRKNLDSGGLRLAYLFIAFMAANAVAHFAVVVTLLVPADASASLYGSIGFIKAITAIAAILTALAIWPEIPKILATPSAGELEEVNASLSQANSALDKALAGRTAELDRANERFETALTGSNITVFTQDTELRYTWIHHPRLGNTIEEVIGRTDTQLMPADAAAITIPLKQEVLDTGETRSTYLAVETDDEGTLYLDLTINPTRGDDGKIDGILCTVLDMTEQNLFEVRLASMASQLADANRRFEAALQGSLITVFEQDLDLNYVHIVNPPPDTVAEDFLGKTDFDLFDEEDQPKVVSAKRQVFETGEVQELEIDVTVDDKQRHYDLQLEPKTTSEGEIVGVIGIAVDLTHKRENEKQMHLVMRELTHRSKNLLAVIQAMARQTAARTADKEQFVSSFSARLQAIAASHDLLVSHSWYGAEIGELVRAHLAQTMDPSSPQIHMEGEPLQVTADAAQNLGLALHELTTNALKYGALSVPSGKVDIEWRRVEGQVTLDWKERDGPPVAAVPDRRGFGRVLLERLVGASLDGDVTLSFDPDGLRCKIKFPESQLATPK
ncbi:MAG: HWE histidine kinase domain-containing protein [Roseibium sp.]|uniref:sensor histidine kinase n=1 Tax=Roseibium sp. TaxID=1936156 RepID=UPI003263ABA6